MSTAQVPGTEPGCGVTGKFSSFSGLEGALGDDVWTEVEFASSGRPSLECQTFAVLSRNLCASDCANHDSTRAVLVFGNNVCSLASCDCIGGCGL